jgi:hypothetical protein
MTAANSAKRGDVFFVSHGVRARESARAVYWLTAGPAYHV